MQFKVRMRAENVVNGELSSDLVQQQHSYFNAKDNEMFPHDQNFQLSKINFRASIALTSELQRV